jgi:hypothetical protein
VDKITQIAHDLQVRGKPAASLTDWSGNCPHHPFETFDGQERVMSRAAYDLQVQATAHWTVVDDGYRVVHAADEYL